MKRVGLRWTIGHVNRRGFEALRFSIWGAWRIFGDAARYAVCVNQVPPEMARERTGEIPFGVEWIGVERREIPKTLRRHLDANMAEGVGWKFAPVRLFPELHELALDNDCILWKLPEAIDRWLRMDSSVSVIAEDVRTSLGCFASLCSSEPRNSGIRGLSPGFDYLTALQRILRMHPVKLRSELDEQGLQTAALQQFSTPLVVTAKEVSICSPFWPHSPEPGECGAHFVGLNAHHIAWSYYDRPADRWMQDHWSRLREILHDKIKVG